MKKILDWFSGGVIKQIGDVIDDLFTSDEERANAKIKVQLKKFEKGNS